MVMVSSAVDEYRATSRDDELGREAHRQREWVQNMLMHCQPQTKANCVKIETKLNSISATTTSRQETLTYRRRENKEDPKGTRSRKWLREDQVHKRVAKPSAEWSTSKEEGADKDRKTVSKTAFSRSRAAERQRGREAESQRSREAFTEGPNKAIAEFRGVPADHEARSQVKVREKSSAAREEALRGALTRRRRRRIHKRGDARVQERDNSHQHTRREVTCDISDTRDSKTSQQCRTNQGTTQWRMCVTPFNTWIYGSYHAVALENSETAKKMLRQQRQSVVLSDRGVLQSLTSSYSRWSYAFHSHTSLDSNTRIRYWDWIRWKESLFFISSSKWKTCSSRIFKTLTKILETSFFSLDKVDPRSSSFKVRIQFDIHYQIYYTSRPDKTETSQNERNNSIRSHVRHSRKRTGSNTRSSCCDNRYGKGAKHFDSNS